MNMLGGDKRQPFRVPFELWHLVDGGAGPNS
jgi:hypothetical protein